MMPLSEKTFGKRYNLCLGGFETRPLYINKGAGTFPLAFLMG
jgi:predicted MPP superfamily phosphohydrolase